MPVPSYLYTYATGAGFAAGSLAGATFDQPYGLWGSPTSLTALHARWDDGPGAALALQQQIVSGDDAYVSASVDAPFRGYAVRSFNAYKRLGARYTASADGSATIYGSTEHAGLTAAFGLAGGALDYRRVSNGFSSFDASLRTPDRPLFGGATWRLKGIVGFDALRGGLLNQLPDAKRYATVWRHGLDLQVASPLVRAPLGTTLSATFDAGRTWYAFPHHYDQFERGRVRVAPAAAQRHAVRGLPRPVEQRRVPQRAGDLLPDAGHAGADAGRHAVLRLHRVQRRAHVPQPERRPAVHAEPRERRGVPACR